MSDWSNSVKVSNSGVEKVAKEPNTKLEWPPIKRERNQADDAAKKSESWKKVKGVFLVEKEPSTAEVLAYEKKIGAKENKAKAKYQEKLRAHLDSFKG